MGNRSGRPPKAIKQEKFIGYFVTHAQHFIIRQKAEEARVNISDYKHTDKEHLHLHILANRVSNTGAINQIRVSLLYGIPAPLSFCPGVG